jgi:DNA mismatch endonuclease (patch repair protein)
MKSNKGKNTSPELALRSALAAARIRGYRIHKKGVPGRPDVSFPKQRLAVFVNGCYWHRCPVCNLPIPKSHSEFWKKKFDLNALRDRRNIDALEAAGWRVLTIWEHEVCDDVAGCVERVKKSL